MLPASLNIGEASSRGVELELYAILTPHLSTQIDYPQRQDGTDEVESVIRVAVPPPPLGTPLPGTPKSSAALSVEYGHVAMAGGDWRFAANAHNARSHWLAAL